MRDADASRPCVDDEFGRVACRRRGDCRSAIRCRRLFPLAQPNFDPRGIPRRRPLHQAILARAREYRGSSAESSLRFIRSSAAPLPPIVLAALEEVFGAPVIEGYGMTETCLYATSNPLPPLARKVGSVGIAAGSKSRLSMIRERLPPVSQASRFEDHDDASGNNRAHSEAFHRTSGLPGFKRKIPAEHRAGGTKVSRECAEQRQLFVTGLYRRFAHGTASGSWPCLILFRLSQREGNGSTPENFFSISTTSGSRGISRIIFVNSSGVNGETASLTSF